MDTVTGVQELNAGTRTDLSTNAQTYRLDGDISYAAEQVISGSAERVWALLSDLANPEMASGFAGIRVEGNGAGALRTLTLPESQGGGVIAEQIEAFDPAARTYIYRVMTFGALPFAAYRARLQASALEHETALLTYQATYRPLLPDHAGRCRDIAADSFAQLVANISRILTGADR